MIAQSYPALMFVVRHGHALAVVCALLVLLAVSGGLPVDRETAIWGLAGLAAGGVTYLLMRGLQDLLRLVAERMIEP